MEIWYVPLTIIPSAGLLILSTTNLQNALSNELSQLIDNDCKKFEQVIRLKIKQLDLLNRALVALYFGAANYILAALIIALSDSTHIIDKNYYKVIVYLGVFSLFLALILLGTYSIRAVKIKKQRFRESLS